MIEFRMNGVVFSVDTNTKVVISNGDISFLTNKDTTSHEVVIPPGFKQITTCSPTKELAAQFLSDSSIGKTVKFSGIRNPQVFSRFAFYQRTHKGSTMVLRSECLDRQAGQYAVTRIR